MEPAEARRILGLESMDEALDRTRLQRAFHRRLFEIHPDTRPQQTGSESPRSSPDLDDLSHQISASHPSNSQYQTQDGGSVILPDAATSLSVDTLIEARRTLLIRLERGNENSDLNLSPPDGGFESENSVGNSRAGADGKGKQTSTAASGSDGYNLYRKALFLYSEAVLEYFEKRKHVNGGTVSEPAAEPDGFRSRLEEARSLFVQVLERFPGGTWTPDSIEQIARINVWLKRDGAGGSQVSK